MTMVSNGELAAGAHESPPTSAKGGGATLNVLPAQYQAQAANLTGPWSRYRARQRCCVSATSRPWRQANARALRQLDQIGNDAHAHFAHQIGAMKLDGLLNRA